MTIAASSQIRWRPFSGYADPRLPIGTWAVNAGVTGDASGGLRVAQIVFVLATAPRASLMWSLEQMHVEDSDNNSKNGNIVASNLDPIISSRTWRIGLGDSTTTALLVLPATYPTFPLWLGGQAVGALTASLDISFANINASVLVVSAEGYIWAARSRSIEGGPQRPAQGLYSP